ncbi:hypothetical protein SMC26_21250 [Actinomadura fulvescens]|uniref:Asp23/Gls24 family envelope stress response protein n=1 Tax=Actinomadura fulvescens TaxID=46160 RepID=A0ABP6BQ59_9ACTN
MTPVEAPAPGSTGAPPAGELAERVAETAVRCRGVARLATDGPERVVTYRPGAPLRGVAVHDDELVVCVVATLERPVFETADEVAAAVAPLADGRSVHVIVGDIVTAAGGADAVDGQN